MNQRNLFSILIILLSVLVFSHNGMSQEIIYQFGKTTKCIVDSNTVKVFLPSLIEKEGMTFIINNDGKSCSSGKNRHPQDFAYMLDQLAELRSKEEISESTYEHIKCSLEKNKRIKEYMALNPSTVNGDVVLRILSSPDCK